MSVREPLSVVIPCRNGEAHLAQAIRSALNQTRPPDAVIVADDGSTDRSAAIAEGFGPPVRVLRGPWGGASAARREGARAAPAGRLMFLDADDLLTPPTLEALEAALDAAPEAVALCPWDRYERLDDRGGDPADAAWTARPPSAALPRPGQDDLEAWLTGSWSPPCAALWSRAAYARGGGWEPRWRLNQDGALMMWAMIRGVRLVRTSRGLACYRRSPGGETSLSDRRRRPEGIAARADVLEEVLEALEAAGRSRRRRPALTEALRALRAEAAGRPELVRRLDALIARAGGVRKRDRPLAAAGRLAARARAGLAARARPGPALPARAPAGPPPPPARSGPLVSVVVPTFNRAALVSRAVASVLSQDYRDLELIVVDDGSTDDTAARLTAIGDARLRVIRQANAGVARARNRGAAEARGAYLGFLDSDDLWLPGKLSRQVAALEAAPGRVGFCYTGWEILWPDGRVERRPPEGDGRAFEALLLRNFVHAPTSSGLVRREVWEAVGGFDPALPAIEDWEWLQRVARLYDLLAIDAPLVRYVEHEADDRRSANFRANMAARAMLHARIRHALRRAGAEHLYLLESARRELKSPHGDAWAGRRRVIEAFVARPWAAELWPWLGYMLAPARMRDRLRRLDASRRRDLRPEPS